MPRPVRDVRIQYPSVAKPQSYSDLFNQTLMATDPAVEKELAQKTMKALVDEAMVIPIQFVREGYASREGVVQGSGRTAAENYEYYFYWRPCDIWLNK